MFGSIGGGLSCGLCGPNKINMRIICWPNWSHCTARLYPASLNPCQPMELWGPRCMLDCRCGDSKQWHGQHMRPKTLGVARKDEAALEAPHLLRLPLQLAAPSASSSPDALDVWFLVSCAPRPCGRTVTTGARGWCFGGHARPEERLLRSLLELARPDSLALCVVVACRSFTPYTCRAQPMTWNPMGKRP